ncbi:uncharacterized protein I303_104440 [Kwoniella dejecticola CBS 10117]|uniref:Uncharacterized protein n=1 Tax=Kwoniella dejecticola CBS 10117 TaxID=1296121 RepID=A0A1A6A5C2_9TREE|nr:uncharacterized protein I303_04581 [Kwoniella dejecticola CBS 10117]OBR85248.1 hypothetical protein I303_04581 [Kwoniella dejecticola CBS 10117]
METPNTRSRRKRELENSSQEDGPRVAWVHDSQLRKAVLQATEDDPIVPPTPTQCPRPITSLLKSSSSSSGSGLLNSSSGSRPARKRPCRGHRSLPTSSKGPALDTQAGIGSNSLPSLSILSNAEKEKEKTRLDYLLDRFSLLSSPLDDEKNRKADYVGVQVEAETPSRNTRSKHQIGSATGGMITSTPLRRKSVNTNTNVDSAMRPRSTRKSSDKLFDGNENLISNSMLKDRNLGNDPNAVFHPSATSSSSLSSKPDPHARSNTIRKPLSPIKGHAPRIGLGSQQAKPIPKPSITSNRIGGWTRTSSGKAFRTPFLGNDHGHNHIQSTGIRSSPRKNPMMSSSSSSKTTLTSNTRSNLPIVPNVSLRGSIVPTTGISIPSRSNTTSTSDRLKSPNKRPANYRTRTNNSNTSSSANSSLPPTPPAQPGNEVGFTNFDVGENDPEDTSFDSFDGIFAGGGEEIERLLRSVDGSAR